MVLWVSLSVTLRLTLRIVFQSHLVLSASMRLTVKNDSFFCFFYYFSIFFSKFWYFIIVINPIFLCNSDYSLMPQMGSKLPEIYFDGTIFLMWRHLVYQFYFSSLMRGDFYSHLLMWPSMRLSLRHSMPNSMPASIRDHMKKSMKY